MIINNANVNFGKKFCAKCTVKDNFQTKHPVSIYEYYPRNFEDMEEIQGSNISDYIKRDFFKEGYSRLYAPESKYYAMKDDNTGEFVACAKTTQHYSLEGKYSGIYTSIDELDTSDKYISSQMPMIAFIADRAKKHISKNLITAQRDYETASLRECKFQKTKDGYWSLRSKAFDECILRAENKNNLEFLA